MASCSAQTYADLFYVLCYDRYSRSRMYNWAKTTSMHHKALLKVDNAAFTLASVKKIFPRWSIYFPFHVISYWYLVPALPHLLLSDQSFDCQLDPWPLSGIWAWEVSPHCPKPGTLACFQLQGSPMSILQTMWFMQYLRFQFKVHHWHSDCMQLLRSPSSSFKM